jgi:Arc/MetJ-type ribon-helix-helix transcriptional regulator
MTNYNYVTTNVRLPKNMLKILKLKAFQEEKSVAQLIREAIQELLESKREKSSSFKRKSNSFLKIIGICNSGIKDGSVHHDRDIYGT